ERIYADNFLWATSDGELNVPAAIQAAFVSLYDATGAKLSDLSGVQVDAGQLAEINTAILNMDLSQTWPLTFTGPDGASVTVEVTLFEKVASPTPPDPDGPAPAVPDHRCLGASSFALAWDARASLDADAARLLSGVKAYDVYGNPVATSAIAVDPGAAELDAIHNAPALGPERYSVYPLTFAYDGKAVTVSVRLFDNGPVPPNPGAEALWANDFAYGCSSGELTAALARQLSGVWGIQKSGYPFARTQITPDAAQLAAIEVARAVHTLGSYPLVFRAGDAAEVAITVTLRDNGPVPPAPGRDTLTANDFLYGLDEPALTEAIIRSLSFVQGMDEDGNHLPDAAIVADAERLAALLAHFEAGRWGVFEMRYTTANGGEVDFKVTLQQHGSLPPAPPGTDQITANDFSYGVGEAALSAEIAKFLAHVVCRDANGVPVDVGLIAVDAGQLAAIQAAQVAGTIGDFPLRFTSPDANSVTVSVSLTNEGGPTVMPGITPGTGTPHIAANDFALGADEPPLFAAVARALSKVSATDKDGFPIACGQIAVNDAELAAIRAAQAARTVTTLPLSFSLASGEWISVAVRLYHHGAGSVDTSDPDRPRQTSAHLNGNDFTYGCSEPDLTRETAAWLSRVTARDASGNPIDPRQLGVSDAELAVIVSAQHSKTLGTYPLTFTAADGSSLTIYVTLHHVGAGGITAGSDTSHLTANNFTYNVAQSLLDARIVLSHSSPVAIDRNGVPAANATISVHAADISALIAAQRDLRAETNYDGRSADYFVRLIHDGQALRITVTLIKDADQRPSMPSQPAAVSEDKGSYSVRYFAGGIDVTGMPEDVFDLSDGDLHTIAAAPKRRGYAFAGWRGSDEKTYRPADSYTIDGSSLALTAIWKSGSTTWLANYGSPDPDSSPFDADNFAEAVTEQNIPVFGVPLYGPKGFAVWSLANLLMLLSGLVIAAIFVFRLLRCRQGHGAQHVQSSAAQRRPLLFMGGGAALACINVLIFALTQNLSLPMAWFDAWSAVMAVVMVLETVVLLVGNCGMKDSTDDRITSPYRE
ncbi:MAG: hypothetical protein LBP28_08875, partial [Coriobacteriales bacterium]|nr:hypothetical protein [Coriobacteriales bacterium]